MCESELGVVPGFHLPGNSVEIPIYVNGVLVTSDQEGIQCDNYSVVEDNCEVGSRIGRLEGVDDKGNPLPHVVWIYFVRKNDGFVQMIGTNTITGATAFFEMKDNVHRKIKGIELVDGMIEGYIPGINDKKYNKAWKSPKQAESQNCVACHKADPFIISPYVEGLLDQDGQALFPSLTGINSPYFRISDGIEHNNSNKSAGLDTEMRTMHIDGNGCVSCHRFTDYRVFGSTPYSPNSHMPLMNPGSMASDLQEMLNAIDNGPESVPNAEWRTTPGN
ncbi:MAG: hypothetical protein P8P74_08365 [Crocinitomicaceae bacterium]|nr:hypothetical protein [Crocinitomicaceae bacterium]